MPEADNQPIPFRPRRPVALSREQGDAELHRLIDRLAVACGIDPGVWNPPHDWTPPAGYTPPAWQAPQMEAKQRHKAPARSVVKLAYWRRG